MVLHITMLRTAAKSISLIPLKEEVSWILGRALIINVFEFSLEGIFNLFFRQDVSRNKADVKEFCLNTDLGYSFIHKREPRGNVAISASEFVLINMAPAINIARC